MTIAVQVNGKRRDEITVAKDLDAKAVEAMVLKLEVGRPCAGGTPRQESDCGARPDRQYCRMMRKRPAVLIVVAALLLAGCGYRPLYWLVSRESRRCGDHGESSKSRKPRRE